MILIGRVTIRGMLVAIGSN
jgi:hypothetical protein